MKGAKYVPQTREIMGLFFITLFILGIVVSSGCVGQEEEPPMTTTPALSSITSLPEETTTLSPNTTTTIIPLTTSESVPKTVKTQIGPSGGMVGSEGGASAMIPQDALTEDIEIIITTYDTLDTITNHLGFTVPIYGGGADFGPEGLEFQKSVTITIPTTLQIQPGLEYPLFLWVADPGQWRETQIMAIVNPDGTSISADVTHFSLYGVFGLPPEARMLGKFKTFLGSGEDPYGAFADYVEWFKDTIKPFEWKTLVQELCYGIVGLEFDIGVKMNEFEENFQSLEGEQTDLALTFVYDDAYVIGDSQTHISMRVILYIGCVPTLIVEADQVVLQVDKPTPIRAHLWCGSSPMDNKEIRFSISGLGDGEVHPSITATVAGEATTTFTATKEGVVTVTASYTGCSGEPEQKMLSDSVELIIEATDRLSLEVVRTDLEVGEETTITARLLNGTTPIIGKSIKFSISGPGDLGDTVVTTLSDGEAKTTFKATDQGVTSVTATYEDLSAFVIITIEEEGVQQWTGTLTIEFSGADNYYVWESRMTIDFRFTYYWPIENSPNYPYGNINGTGSATTTFSIEILDSDCDITEVNVRSFDVIVIGMTTNPGILSGTTPVKILIRQQQEDDRPIIDYTEKCGEDDIGYTEEIYFALVDYYDESSDGDDHWISISLEEGASAEGAIINPDTMLMLDDGTNGTFRITIHRVG